MLELIIPGREPLQLTTLVSDVNGTLAVDGRLIEGVAPLMQALGQSLQVILLSADTMGTAQTIAQELGVSLHRLTPGDETHQKTDFVKAQGSQACISLGQGANDEGMLREAALGIAVLSKEGSAVHTVMAADIVVPDILTALELLQHPKRIVATLRQ